MPYLEMTFHTYLLAYLLVGINRFDGLEIIQMKSKMSWGVLDFGEQMIQKLFFQFTTPKKDVI